MDNYWPITNKNSPNFDANYTPKKIYRPTKAEREYNNSFADIFKSETDKYQGKTQEQMLLMKAGA